MSALRPQVKAMVANARFSSAEVAALRQAIRSGAATLEDAKAIALNYADTLETGVGAELRSLLMELGGGSRIESPIAHLGSETALLNGQVILPTSGRNHPSVRHVQRALIAIANRANQPLYMLPSFGADGDYGAETIQVIKTFQQRTGLPITGKVDMKTARTIDRILRQTVVPNIMGGNPTGIVELAKAAQDLCTGAIAQHYGVDQPWINIDPNHVVPINRPFEFLRGKWKCNLFGGNVLYRGGYQPPYYNNQGKGEYPNANQWYKWSDKYAAQHGNKVHFKLIAEVNVESLPVEKRDQAIAEFLTKTQPGDFVMADHPGTQIADGGHTRVATTNNFQSSGTVSFAQASFDRAQILNQGVEAFTWDERIWLLRPSWRR